MSLPQAQQSRRAQMQANIAQAADGMVNDPAPAAPPAAVKPVIDDLDLSIYAVDPNTLAPVATPPDKTAAPAIDWEEEAKKNEQRWHTLQGIYERERAERLALEARLNTNNPLPPTPIGAPIDDFQPVSFNFEDPELEFTDAEKETYEASFSVIQKAARKEAMKLVQTAMEPLTREIQQLRGASRKLDDMTEKSFLSTVRGRVPNLDNITASAAWKEYVATRVPFTGMTVGQALMQAHNARDLDRVAEIFDAHQGKATSNAVSALSAPTVAGASAIPRQQGEKPKLKWSERAKAHDAFVKGRITHEKLLQIDGLYKTADAEGRIDYNS